jgi:acetoin utilization deacetylase AcuC-like enzyme
VLSDESTVFIFRRERIGGVEDEAQGGGVRAQRIIGFDGRGNHLCAGRADAVIDVLAVITIGPAVKATIFYGCHVIRHEIAAQFVTFIDGGPELVCDGVPIKTNGVAEARSEDARIARAPIDFENGSAVDFLVHTVFTDIAVGSDTDIKLAAVRAGDQAFCPVMIELAAGKVGKAMAWVSDFGLSFFIREAHDGIRIGDVEIAVDLRHAEGRVEVFKEYATGFGNTVIVCIAQECNSVGALAAGAGGFLREAHEEALDATAVFFRRLVALGHQHVAVGKNIEPARMIEAGGEGGNRETLGPARFLTIRPADDGGDFDGRNQALLRLNQGWVRAHIGAVGQGRFFGAGIEREAEQRQGKNQNISEHGRILYAQTYCAGKKFLYTVCMTIAVYTHNDCLLHDTGPGHPENPGRLVSILEALKICDFAHKLEMIDAPLGDMEDILRAHGREYFDSIEEAAPAKGIIYLDGDTVMSPGSYNAARRGVGAARAAIDTMDKYDTVFCAVRPPGHHAERDRAMGFCLFDNVAIAVLYAIEVKKFERVAIIDFDVHHGNGTQDIFEQDGRVLYISTHQWPLYPGTGHPAEKGVGNILNIPLEAGTRGEEYRKAFELHIVPALEKFQPELLLASAGFDAHREDPLAGLGLTEEDFGWTGQFMRDFAKKHCKAPVVSFLEGGYNHRALADSVVAYLRAFI